MEQARSIGFLIELSCDSETCVRDWATFALGTIQDWDEPALREALFERLHDEDDEVRAEAMSGLAKRGDRRVVDIVRAELESESAGWLDVEAAAMMGAPELVPSLIAIQGRWKGDDARLQEAIRACAAGR